ncbi:hypothetical protein [Agrobacterium pusense]|uniref:hypothetical protein n=1 Tax=Agrobacterium pusense TaxID=648995 RepID=UPI002F3E9A51
MEGKKCSRCGEIKPLTDFHKSKAKKGGLAYHCKQCDAARKAEYRSANKEKVREQGRALYEANPEKRRAAHTRWVKSNPEKMREAKRRCRLTPKAKIENAIRGYIHKTITRGSKSGRTFDLLGYTSLELMRHLERLFKPGMSWENYGEWHIDHKIPLSAFNYSSTDEIDFRRAWSLENLQPLWAVDNMRKHAKLDQPFQPSLALKIPLAANDNTKIGYNETA